MTQTIEEPAARGLKTHDWRALKISMDVSNAIVINGVHSEEARRALGVLLEVFGLSSTRATIAAQQPKGASVSIMVSDDAGGVATLPLAKLAKGQPLPAIHGARNGAAVIQRLQAVVSEIADGARKALTKEQELTLKAEMVFAYWQAIHGHPKAIMDEKRERRIIAQLRANGGDVSELFYTVQGAKRDKAIQGEMSDSTGKYDGIETIFRDRGQVERLANHMTNYRNGIVHPMVEKYAAAFNGEPAPATESKAEPSA